MLARDYRDELIARLAETDCHVAVPRAMAHLFQKTPPQPLKPDDRRRFARFRCPQRTLMETSTTFRDVPRESAYYSVLMTDVSRNGVSFLHSEQLLPGESVTVWFPQKKVACAVARCVRHNARCFEIGCAFEDGPQVSGWLKQLGCRLAASESRRV